VVIIKGNHDPSLQSLESIFPGKQVLMEYEFYIGDEAGIVVHGDGFDSMITKYSWLTRVFSPIHWVLERFGINIKAFFRELFYSIANKRDKDYYKEFSF